MAALLASGLLVSASPDGQDGKGSVLVCDNLGLD